MQTGLFVTLETESRFDVSAHLADLTAQVRTAKDAGFDSLWFPQHFVTGPSMRQFAASPIMMGTMKCVLVAFSGCFGTETSHRLRKASVPTGSSHLWHPS